MSSSLASVVKKNGLRSSFFLLSKRLLERTAGGLLRVANQLPTSRLSTEQKVIISKNELFKNKHAGQRGFVIGTGPSIQTQDLRPLANEITFSLSGFWKHPIVREWRPTYYCFSDPLLFDGSAPTCEFFKTINENIPDSTFFVPLSSRESIERNRLLPPDKTQYVAFRGDLSENPVSDLDLTQFVPGVMNVAQLCIMAAIYMGLSPIYLMGLDHDWLSHRGETRHFYAGHAGLEKHPEVKPLLADWSYRFLMECQLVGWKAYENLRILAERKNTQIFNATNGGFLDVFERVDYRELI